MTSRLMSDVLICPGPPRHRTATWDVVPVGTVAGRRHPGRPKKAPEQKLSVFMTFRFTPGEADAICRAAIVRGIGVNQHVRELLRVSVSQKP